MDVVEEVKEFFLLELANIKYKLKNINVRVDSVCNHLIEQNRRIDELTAKAAA